MYVNEVTIAAIVPDPDTEGEELELTVTVEYTYGNGDVVDGQVTSWYDVGVQSIYIDSWHEQAHTDLVCLWAPDIERRYEKAIEEAIYASDRVAA